VQILADQTYAIYYCIYTNQLSREEPAKNKLIINSFVHLLLAAGIICAAKGFTIPKLYGNAICFITSAVLKPLSSKKYGN
jgi:hypothetical protein